MLASLLMAPMIAPPDLAAVSVKLFRFGPDTLLVPAGTVVTWRNEDAAYRKLREAAQHMQMIGDPVAAAIARQFPERFALR